MDLFNIIVAAIFATTTTLTTLKILSRVKKFQQHGINKPALITRDIFVVLLGGFPIAFALLFRALGMWDTVATHPIWIIYSNISWMLVGLIFVYYEYFIIDK